MNLKIYGFYHIWAINNYIELVQEQLNHIITSNLMNKTEKIFIGIIGEEDSVEIIKNIVEELQIEKYELMYFGNDASQFEYPTLKKIDNLAEVEDFYCYYLHSKGLSYFIDSDNLKHVEEYKTDLNHRRLLFTEYLWLYNKYPAYYDMVDMDDMYSICKYTNENLEIWRKYMEFFQMDQHELCISYLSYYDVVGTHLVDHYGYNPHFRGNFWWSKSSHIKSLPNIKNVNKLIRRNAESWVTSHGKNFKSLHNPKLKRPLWVDRLSDDYLDKKNWNI